MSRAETNRDTILMRSAHATMLLLTALFFLYTPVTAVGQSQPAPAKSESDTSANYLQHACRSFVDGDEHYFEAGVCGGMLEAIRQFAQVRSGARHKVSGLSITIPAGVTRGQLAKIFLKYVDDHPEKLHEPAAFVVLESLRLAFQAK